MFHSNFSGSYPTVIPGGLHSVNNKTYEYLDKDGDGTYEYIIEYKESGQLVSRPYWYSYDWIRPFVFGGGFSKNSLKNGYPTYDKETGLYTYYGNSDNGSSVIKGVLYFGYMYGLIAYNSDIKALTSTNYSSTSFGFKYDSQGNLEEMSLTTKVTFYKGYKPEIDKDYTWVVETTVKDIGTTKAKTDEIISGLTFG